MALVPVKDYVLGTYVTRKFDEVRDDVVARMPNGMHAVMSGVHYFDVFARDSLPLLDSATHIRMRRNDSRHMTLPDLLAHTSVSRSSLLAILPPALLATKISLMANYYAPLCGPTWSTDAQLLFGRYFPSIQHEFCGKYGEVFPHTRFFNSAGRRSGGNSTFSPLTSLGVIGLVNMSEVDLRHFHSSDVIRALTRSVLSGFLQENSSAPATVNFSDGTADAIVQRYGGGISVFELIELLPRDNRDDDAGEHVRLIDVVGISIVLDHFISPQQLEMGWNINSEPAVIAEVSIRSSLLSIDHLVTIIGMAPVFPAYMAPFWNCGIEHTTMDKALRLDQVNADAFVSCGHEKAALIPAYTVNLMYLVQKSFRDYAKLDNSSHFVVGRDRKFEFDVPEKLTSSPLLGIDGDAWSKKNYFQEQSPPLVPTPYGYLYTRDCAHLVNQVSAENGRNVQKYQLYIGDGLGNCHFHDSQETEPQVLCRLIFQDGELLLRDLNGVDHANLSKCSDLAPLTSMEQQRNFRQIEWFGTDNKFLVKRTRIRDNTSRQIRTFLLALSLLGSISYVCEYLIILKSMWKFTRNSIGTPAGASRGLRLHEVLLFDPAVGALQRPGTVVLLYLGTVGALSNIFTLACHAKFAESDGKIAIDCSPLIPISNITLMLTTLSSGFWIALITQQTRLLGKRLRGQRDPLWIRNWVLMHVSVLGIYGISKFSTDLALENVTLHSDPHIYAIAGGVVMSLFISLAFRAIHYSSWSQHMIFHEEREGAADQRVPDGRRLSRFPSFSAHSATMSERNFLTRWNSSRLDNVLQQCASPTIALQLVWYCNLRHCYEHQERMSQCEQEISSGGQSRTASSITIASSIRVSDFVAVHVAAGAWVHLESLAWSYNDRCGLLLHTKFGRERPSRQIVPANS